MNFHPLWVNSYLSRTFEQWGRKKKEEKKRRKFSTVSLVSNANATRDEYKFFKISYLANVSILKCKSGQSWSGDFHHFHHKLHITFRHFARCKQITTPNQRFKKWSWKKFLEEHSTKKWFFLKCSLCLPFIFHFARDLTLRRRSREFLKVLKQGEEGEEKRKIGVRCRSASVQRHSW